MKKILYLLPLLLFAFSILEAQQFKAGLLAGLTPSQVDGDGMTGYHKIGFTAGAFVKWEQGKNLIYRMDIAYTDKGSRQASSKNMNYSSLEITTSYVDLTLSVGYKLTDNIVLRAGLVPAVLINHKEETPDGFVQTNGVEFRRLNLLAMGAIDYSLSNRWSVSLAYDYSIISIRKGKIEIFDYDIKQQYAQYHNYITLGVNYCF